MKNIDEINDEIDDLEEQRFQINMRLEELYEIRQEIWEKEKAYEELEYERSVL